MEKHTTSETEVRQRCGWHWWPFDTDTFAADEWNQTEAAVAAEREHLASPTFDPAEGEWQGLQAVTMWGDLHPMPVFFRFHPTAQDQLGR